MKYVLYNNENGKYIKADSQFGYTEIVDDALKFKNEESANDAMAGCLGYDIQYDVPSRVILACNTSKLSVVEIS